MMKQGKRKIIAFCVAVIAIMLFVFSTAIAEDASETPTPDSTYWKVIKYEEIEQYRNNPEVIDGYLFAGWFADKSCAQETALTRSVKTGTAYAKYVPEEILGLKAQVNGELWNSDFTDDGTGAIRFVTSVESLDYAKVGFSIDIGNGAKDKASNIVYKELYVKVGGDTAGSKKAEEFKPNELFHASSIYFKAWTITDVPELNYLTQFTVTPFWVTLDGTRVEGTTSIKTVNQGRSWEYVFVDDAGSDNGENDNEIGLGTYNKPYKTLDYALEQMSEYQIKKNILKYSTNTTDTDGKVYVKNSLTAGTDFKWSKRDLDVTITGDTGADTYATVDFSARTNMSLGNSVTFEKMNLIFPKEQKSGDSTTYRAVYANGHRLQISEDVTTTNVPKIFGGTSASGEVIESTHVTLLAGTYQYIYGGSNETKIAGDTYVYVGGNASGVRVYGGSYDGTVEGDTYATVGENANLEYVFGSGQSGSQKVLGTCYVTVEGNANIAEAVQGGGTGGSTNNTYVVIKGGTMQMVCGGQGTAGGTVNNTNVHILGGTITRRVYGGNYNDYKPLGGGWQGSNEVSGYSSVTIGAFDAISGRSTNQDDTSISASSRIGSKPEKEVGVMLIGSDEDESKIGWSSDMKRLVGTEYTHFLVKVGDGGTVTSESGILRITPDSNSSYQCAIVKDGDTPLFQCQGEGTYSLSRLTKPSDVKELTVEFVDSANLDGDYVLSYEDSEGNVCGTSAFSSLEAAMASASTPNIGGAGTQKTAVITIGATDVTVDETIALTNGKNVVLKNKEGVDVTLTRATTSNMFDVAVGCSLTINGAITVDGNKANVQGPAMIKNAGAFTLGENATLQNAKTTGEVKGGAVYNTGKAYIHGELKNNEAYDGGAIYITSKGTVELSAESEASISGNTATHQGGAIYVNNGTLKATGYLFTGNKAINHNNAYGGAIYVNAYMDGTTPCISKAELYDCVFGEKGAGNSGKAGGAILVAGRLIADNCIFKYNETNLYSGGAIDVSETNANFDASFTITNSSFENNTSYVHGGAIDINGGGTGVNGTDNFQIIDCTFSGNRSTNGNTISVRQAGAQVDVSNVTFKGDASGNVDVIYLHTATNAVGISGKVTSAVIKMNAAAKVLVNGMVDEESDITITPSAYTEGLQVMDKADASMSDATLKYVTEIPVLTQKSRNYWFITSEGKLSEAVAMINGTEVSYEDVLNEIAKGEKVEIQFLRDIEVADTMTIPAGADVTITNAEGKNVIITRTTASNLFNIAEDAKLTIGTADSAKTITIDGENLSGTTLIKNAGTFVTNNNVTIKNVNAGDNNGGVLNNAGTATLNGTITKNTAKQGVVAYNTGTVTIKTGTYSHNVATSGGAVIFNSGSAAIVNIEDGLFENNEAQGATGGVISGNAKTTITGGTFQNNTAAKGASVLNVASGYTADISNATITGNTAVDINSDVFNGAIYVSASGKLTLESCNIYNNVGIYDGLTNPGCDVSLGGSVTLNIKNNTNVGVINKRASSGTIKISAEYTGKMTLIPYNDIYETGSPLVTFDSAMSGKYKENTVKNIIVRDYVSSKDEYTDDMYCVDTDGLLQYKDAEAKVETKTYLTLAQAIAAAGNEDIVYVLKDIKISEKIALTDGKQLVLQNKEGVNVTITRATTSNMFDVASGCSLTIDGKITVDGDKGKVTGPAMIKNAGTFVLGEEAILQNATTACTSNAAAYNGAALYNTGIANIYGDIKNNKAYNGGAICIDDSNGVVNLYTESGASISGNTATNQGGAIYINRGVLNAEGYSFTENKSTGSYGGAIYINAYMSGTTLYMAEAELSECVFGAEDKGNSGRAGGAIFVAGSLKADHCTFKYNKTTGLSGGAIDVSETNANFDASFMITNSSFENNTSEAHGGAIDINGGGSGVDGTDNFQIVDCTFSGNSGKNGNTISVRQAGAQVDVSNVTFEGDASGNADVIYLDQVTNAVGISGEITGVVVKVKAAAQVLVNGTVDADSDITITPSAYTEGLQVMDKANDTVDAKTFADATEILAVTRESGNYWYITSEGKLSTADAKINGVEGYYTDVLAAIANGGEVEIQFLNDIEIATTITIPADANVTITGADDVDVTITRATTSNMFNVASGSTLTIGTADSAKTITIDGADLSGTTLIQNAGKVVTNNNVTIKDVNAGSNKGGVLNNTGEVTLNGTMTGNTASQGAIVYNKGKVTIQSGTYSDNSATSGGVVVYNDKNNNNNVAEVYIVDGTFEGNAAQGGTGGVVSGTFAKLEITGGTFRGNTATTGGAVVNVSGSCKDAKISNATITGNKVLGAQGRTDKYFNGAIYLSGGAGLTLTDCNISGNVGFYLKPADPGCDIGLGANTTLNINDNTSVGVIWRRDPNKEGTINILTANPGTMTLIPYNGTYTINSSLVTFDSKLTDDAITEIVKKIKVRKYTSATEYTDDLYCVDTAGKLQNK